MSEMNNLQKALLIVEEERSHKYDDLYDNPEMHEFSQKYLVRRREIISMYKDPQVVIATSMSTYRRTHKIRLRTILVAALIMLLATAFVIAITTPHIYYVIKEKIGHWTITFTQEDNTDESALTPVWPQIPEGFSVTENEATESHFYISMEDNDNHIIIFEQLPPDGASVNIDSERNENTIGIINETEVIISREGNAIMMIFNDGNYVYHIRGNASEKILREIADDILNKQ